MKETSSSTQEQWPEEQKAYLATLQLVALHGVAMSIKTAIELDVFNILAATGDGGELTSSEIAARIPNCLPGAAFSLDRVLRFLASHSILRCVSSVAGDGNVQRRYALEPIYRLLANNQDGVSLAPAFLVTRDMASLGSWQYLKDAVLEDIDPFAKANGLKPFEYMATKDRQLGEHFNQFMASVTKLTSEKIVEAYKEGFQGISKLVDVGGGIGAMLSTIISKHPHIEGINFDLPHVINNAPEIPGVEHVAGDILVGNIPSADAIILKWILHNWSDEDCVLILKNCYKALPETGKLIVVEQILPEIPERKDSVRDVYFMDLSMMVFHHPARERTERELRDLSTTAGFVDFKVACYVFNYYVMELIK